MYSSPVFGVNALQVGYVFIRTIYLNNLVADVN